VNTDVNEIHVKALNLYPMGNVKFLASPLILRQKWKEERN